MNTPVTEEELFELIKKYSFFYENDLNTFTKEMNTSNHKYHFSNTHNLKHTCTIALDKFQLIIKKHTPILSVERELYNDLIILINKYKELIISKHEFETLFTFTQIKRILLSLDIAENSVLFSFLLSHIKTMEEWSSQTYENQGISFCLGIDKKSTEQGIINLSNLYDEPFCKVFTNGIETMIICDKNGQVITYLNAYEFFHKEKKRYTSTSYTTTKNNSYNQQLKKNTNNKHQEIITPHIFQWLANWTEEDERIVIHLNSRGEILIFNNGTLAFAKRNSRWHITKLTPLAHLLPEKSHYNKKMKKALTETCIDVAFRRTGACIGILNNDLDATKHNITNENNKDDKQLIASQDILKNSSSNKTIFFNQLIDNKKFQDLPRELRQELVAVDGATILDKEGNILAVGAILNLDSNPQTEGNERRQGGRSTAAKQLAHYGVGIKVSADGGITAWQKDKDNPDYIKKIFELF